MKITLSTKPLVDSLSLGVVNANVSKFFQRSCMAGITIEGNSLIVNLEAAAVYTKIILKGSPEVTEDTASSVFVDSLLLKQLVATLDSPTVTLDVSTNGLCIISGKSKFVLPKMLEDVDLELRSPNESVVASPVFTEIDRTGWKYIKDYQMYAIAVSFIHPAFTKVWVGENGDVIVGDYDNSHFTHTKKSNLGKTCLLSDTAINLFNSLPEGARLYTSEDHFVVTVNTDSYSLISEFVPETGESVGEYPAELILSIMAHNPETAVKVSPAAMNKFLGQASLLSSSADDTIKMSVKDRKIVLEDQNSRCSVPVHDGSADVEYELVFKTDFLKSVISHYVDEDFMYVCPGGQDNDGQTISAIFWNNELTTVLAGTD